jgi:hypothetical protein
VVARRRLARRPARRSEGDASVWIGDSVWVRDSVDHASHAGGDVKPSMTDGRLRPEYVVVAASIEIIVVMVVIPLL